MTYKSISLAVFLQFSILISGCMAEDRSSFSPPPFGGQCDYKNYTGKAEIVSITRKPGPKEKYEIKFAFYPDKPIKEDFARTKDKKYQLLLSDSSAPGPDFLDKFKVSVGKRFDCIMKVITKGTCTPIIFEFPGLDLSRSDQDNIK